MNLSLEFYAGDPDQIPELTQSWLQAVAEEAEDEDDVATESPAAVAAVSALVALCREARTRGTSVVFAFSLSRGSPPSGP